ncbi:MAG: hypothetical protein BWK77_06345 [Verrucomicrobia bacterium A1]|nr:MAG: hypothetical protein BWK77_06345 [Verrucomicrobia bacterium A1]
MSVTLDASVLLAARFAAEPHHGEAERALRALIESGEPLVLPTLALVEISAAVARKCGRADRAEEAVAALRKLPNQSAMPLTESVAHEAAGIAARRGLRGADAVYAATAHLTGSVLLTLDKELRRRTGNSIPCQTPAEWLGDRPDSAE